MANEKELKDTMNGPKKAWVESKEIVVMAQKIYDSGKLQIQAPDKMKFYFTNGVKELESKKFRASLVKDLLRTYLPEVEFILAIDSIYWSQLDEIDKVYTVAYLMLSCSINESGKAAILGPDIKEHKDLVKADYLDLQKLVDINK